MHRDVKLCRQRFDTSADIILQQKRKKEQNLQKIVFFY